MYGLQTKVSNWMDGAIIRRRRPCSIDDNSSEPRTRAYSSMTKSELIARLAARFPQLAARDTDFATNMILDEISAALVRGQRIEIRGVGSFSITYRPARIGRNPKSGDQVHVPEKYVPHFKAGKDLRERVDQRD